MRSRRTRTTALLAACVAVALMPFSSATLVSAVEAVTRGIGAKLQEFKGGEGLVVSPADIEGLLNTPCGELGGGEEGEGLSVAGRKRGGGANMAAPIFSWTNIRGPRKPVAASAAARAQWRALLEIRGTPTRA